MQNMTTKKKIIYIAVAVVLVAILATGTVLILKAVNGSKADSSKTQTPVPTAKEQADTQMTNAIQTLHSDPVKSKELLLQLRQKYKDIGDTNGVINVDAQIFLIDHPKTTTK